MWRNILRASAGKLPRFMDQYGFCFARPASRSHAATYVAGLLQAQGRKSIEPIALHFAPRSAGVAPAAKEVLALQRFLTDSPWDPQDVQYQLQAHVAEELLPSAAASPLGVVGIIDESSFEKSGPHSVGVKRQYCGHLGKTDNCQVGVFLVASVPAGEALLDHQLYLPKEWIKDRTRRKKARVPRARSVSNQAATRRRIDSPHGRQRACAVRLDRGGRSLRRKRRLSRRDWSRPASGTWSKRR